MKIEKLLLEPGINDKDFPLLEMYKRARELSEKLPEDVCFIETGTRNGDSAMVFLKAILESGKKRWLFTVDPYGDKPYGVGEIVSTTYGYEDQHYRNAMYSLSKYAWDNDLLHYHYRLRSQEFATIAEQTEFWYNGKQVKQKYGLIYLDGEHTFEAISKELELFMPHLVQGGQIIIDDISFIGEKVNDLPIKGTIEFNKFFYTHE